MNDQNKNKLVCPKCGCEEIEKLTGTSRDFGARKEGGKLPNSEFKTTDYLCNNCGKRF